MLLSRWEIMGAAVASLLGYMTTALVLLFHFRKVTGYPLGRLVRPNWEDVGLVRDRLAALVSR
jgi:Na+-driven multidrug efflux pump